MKTKFVIFFAILFAATSAFAQGSYKQPPKEIMDVLNAAAIPATSISPTRDKIAMLTPLRYPPISPNRCSGLRVRALIRTLTPRIFRVML